MFQPSQRAVRFQWYCCATEHSFRKITVRLPTSTCRQKVCKHFLFFQLSIMLFFFFPVLTYLIRWSQTLTIEVWLYYVAVNHKGPQLMIIKVIRHKYVCEPQGLVLEWWQVSMLLRVWRLKIFHLKISPFWHLSLRSLESEPAEMAKTDHVQSCSSFSNSVFSTVWIKWGMLHNKVSSFIMSQNHLLNGIMLSVHQRWKVTNYIYSRYCNWVAFLCTCTFFK